MSFRSAASCLKLVSRRLARPPAYRSPIIMPTCSFSSTKCRRAAFAEQPPSQPTKLLFIPSKEYLEEEEIDIELPADKDIHIVITDRAAEKLRAIAKREGNPEAALRIAVESGGCHGYQYKMNLAKHRSPDDYLFSHPSIFPSNILVDAISLTLLNGSTIDFATELIGSSFRVTENPHAKGSGCGCGVSWELKI
ncbi:uncharacterized protein BT62DRAFT_928286 [Guyanagaster necrorhizus]|uniref:Core domain-containing protein n=1 Tax=Guyanagaster necrorhizus TaxID=856835 RepID=A0A9P8AVQ5_9AGAR|nr:uncharacterized protein BT62DRAFT_928286 [Guyanagaster necrorhizus MCA 3950]KAG7449570.1 hypothetical protein BT62DRAFT_928286 [Guyanagaster necrorhizus MCA 3950]